MKKFRCHPTKRASTICQGHRSIRDDSQTEIRQTCMSLVIPKYVCLRMLQSPDRF
jgi:hypothetical protein